MPPDPHKHRLSVKVKRVDECDTLSELITQQGWTGERNLLPKTTDA